MTGPFGEMMSGVLISLANWERRMIAALTKDVLTSKARAGVRLGKQRQIEPTWLPGAGGLSSA